MKTSIEHSYAAITSLSTDMEFADDINFTTESLKAGMRKTIKKVARNTLANHNLMVNYENTEKTIIERKANKGEEEWRSGKKLGSLLGKFENVKRRIPLSNVAVTKNG